MKQRGQEGECRWNEKGRAYLNNSNDDSEKADGGAEDFDDQNLMERD
jgi:hypothetical protein